jgi:3-methyl-2-oxobutanoate hydroxymethyltransferase
VVTFISPSLQESPEFALKNALRFIKESGVDCVKLEGGEIRAPTVKKLVESGIAVMGHVGLTPQGVSVLGGFRAQGRTATKARQILNDAMALQRAGAFGLVIECVPEIVAKAVTESLKVQWISFLLSFSSLPRIDSYDRYWGREIHQRSGLGLS